MLPSFFHNNTLNLDTQHYCQTGKYRKSSRFRYISFGEAAETRSFAEIMYEAQGAISPGMGRARQSSPGIIYEGT